MTSIEDEFERKEFKTGSINQINIKIKEGGGSGL
jgi:hypothetical protein